MPKGQEETFIELLEQYKESLFRICRVYATNRSDQEDLFQEVVFNIWKSWDSFREESTMYTWLYRIALNVCMRKTYQQKRAKDQKVNLEGIQFHPMDQNDGLEQLETKEQHQALYECIATLQKVDKSIITLYLEELPYQEIAGIVGISENHVAVKVKRIKQALHECLKKEDHV